MPPVLVGRMSSGAKTIFNISYQITLVKGQDGVCCRIFLGMELRRNLTDGAFADPVVVPKQRGLDITHCHQSGSDEEGMFLYRELEFKDAPGSVGSCRCGCTRANEGGGQGRPLSS